jgi:hypothetical protein
MTIELTEQHQRALDAQAETPPRVIDRRSNAAYYLVPAPDYAAIRELLEERRERAIRAVGLRNAVGRMGMSHDPARRQMGTFIGNKKCLSDAVPILGANFSSGRTQ